MFNSVKRRLEDVGITKEQIVARIDLQFKDQDVRDALYSAIREQDTSVEAMPEDWLWQNGYRPFSRLGLIWINEDGNPGWNPYH